MQKDLNTVLTVSKGMKLPPGLFKSISDTVKWHICHSIPMRRVSASSLSTPADAACLYRENGSHLTDPSSVGQDPLASCQEKCAIRGEAFTTRYPSFDHIFYQVVNEDDHLFQEALKYFIDITRRLVCTYMYIVVQLATYSLTTRFECGSLCDSLYHCCLSMYS